MSALDIEVEPGPLPFEEGGPDRGEMWCPGGAPPTGLEFLDCRGTLMCWGSLPCLPRGLERRAPGRNRVRLPSRP
jgi:hypothetical protein